MRVGGIISLLVNGDVYRAKGNFTYNIGNPLREAVIGSDGVHGFKDTPQVAFIEGEITDRGNLNLTAVSSITGATVTLGLANGKTFVLNDAWAAGEFTGNTEEGNISFRMESASPGKELT